MKQSIIARRQIIVFLSLALVAVSSQAQDLTGTLKKVKDTGIITLGYRDSSVPFSYLDSDQGPVGYALDICYEIANAVKLELKLDKLDVKLNPVTSATRIPLIANATIDLECGSTTNTVDRQQQIAFTNSHFLTGLRYVSKKAAGLHGINDLKGKTVISTSGTTSIRRLSEINRERNLGIIVLPARDHSKAFQMVENGYAAAFVMDDVLLASLIATSKDPSAYEISTEFLSRAEPYGIMLRKDDASFQKVVDAATAKLYASTEGKALYNKWFTLPIPPGGINMNLPMSAELQQQFSHPISSSDPAAY